MKKIETHKINNFRCDNCHDKKKVRRLSVKCRNNIEVYELTICRDCVADLYQVLEEEKELYNKLIKFWDNSGIVIMEHYSEPRNDLISGYVKEEDLAIILIADELSYQYIKLSNIQELIKLISRRKRDTINGSVFGCDICDNQDGFARLGENMFLCSVCLDKIEEKLSYYIDKYPEHIISNSI